MTAKSNCFRALHLLDHVTKDVWCRLRRPCLSMLDGSPKSSQMLSQPFSSRPGSLKSSTTLRKLNSSSSSSNSSKHLVTGSRGRAKGRTQGRCTAGNKVRMQGRITCMHMTGSRSSSCHSSCQQTALNLTACGLKMSGLICSTNSSSHIPAKLSSGSNRSKSSSLSRRLVLKALGKMVELTCPLSSTRSHSSSQDSSLTKVRLSQQRPRSNRRLVVHKPALCMTARLVTGTTPCLGTTMMQTLGCTATLRPSSGTPKMQPLGSSSRLCRSKASQALQQML